MYFTPYKKRKYVEYEQASLQDQAQGGTQDQAAGHDDAAADQVPVLGDHQGDPQLGDPQELPKIGGVQGVPVLGFSNSRFSSLDLVSWSWS